MKHLIVALIYIVSLLMNGKNDDRGTIYQFSLKTIDGETKSLADYRGKVLLIVNVASRCGFTPQYRELQALYEKYNERGFMVLAFPSNDFRNQEPGTDAEIKEFCSSTYNVTFDLFSKIHVTGEKKHPLYKFLTEESEFKGEVQWNFQKYLIDRNGTVVGKFAPSIKPLDPQIVEKIEHYLK